MANVIVVDDDQLVRDVVARLLEKAGHKVWRAMNAQDTFTLLSGPNHFDLVIVDLVLHGMSGIELATRLRGEYPALSMVAMSGYLSADSDATITRLNRAGVTEILRKPIDPLQLRTAVNRSLRPD